VFIKENSPPETRNNDRIINQIIKIVGRQEYVEFEQGQALDGADGNRCLEKRKKVCTMCKLKLAINDPTHMQVSEIWHLWGRPDEMRCGCFQAIDDNSRGFWSFALEVKIVLLGGR
jgi:hypothetical protein